MYHFLLRTNKILLTILILLALSNISQQKKSDDSRFDEDTIHDVLEDVRDRIYDFVTSPLYQVYSDTLIKKVIELLKTVDKKTIKNILDMVSKNPDLATKMLQLGQYQRQEQLKKSINPETVKMMTDWIGQLSSSEDPIEMLQNVLNDIGLGVGKKKKKLSSKEKSSSSKDSTTTKQEL